MNKEELIKLREQLMKSNEKYTKVSFEGTYDDVIKAEPFDENKTEDDILDEYDPGIDEQIALDYFEAKVEEIIKNATLNNVSFDGISTNMYFQYYVNDKMAGEIDEHCYLPIDKYDRKMILNNLVRIAFSFDFIKGKEVVLGAEQYLNDPKEPTCKEFMVHYGRFVGFLISRGFEVNLKTFDESLYSNLNGRYPTITLNFLKDYKKNR